MQSSADKLFTRYQQHLERGLYPEARHEWAELYRRGYFNGVPEDLWARVTRQHQVMPIYLANGDIEQASQTLDFLRSNLEAYHRERREGWARELEALTRRDYQRRTLSTKAQQAFEKQNYDEFQAHLAELRRHGWSTGELERQAQTIEITQKLSLLEQLISEKKAEEAQGLIQQIRQSAAWGATTDEYRQRLDAAQDKVQSMLEALAAEREAERRRQAEARAAEEAQRQAAQAETAAAVAAAEAATAEEARAQAIKAECDRLKANRKFITPLPLSSKRPLQVAKMLVGGFLLLVGCICVAHFLSSGPTIIVAPQPSATPAPTVIPAPSQPIGGITPKSTPAFTPAPTHTPVPTSTPKPPLPTIHLSLNEGPKDGDVVRQKSLNLSWTVTPADQIAGYEVRHNGKLISAAPFRSGQASLHLLTAGKQELSIMPLAADGRKWNAVIYRFTYQPNRPPTVQASLDTASITEGKAAILKVSVTDPDDESTKNAALTIDDNQYDIGSGNWSIGKDLKPGKHTLRIVATDAQGAQSEPWTKILTVTQAIAPPKIEFMQSPDPEETINSQKVSLVWKVVGDSAAAKYQVWLNDEFIAESARTDAELTLSRAGEQTVKVVALSAEGEKGEPIERKFTYQPPKPTLKISRLRLTPDTLKSGGEIQVQLEGEIKDVDKDKSINGSLVLFQNGEKVSALKDFTLASSGPFSNQYAVAIDNRAPGSYELTALLSLDDTVVRESTPLTIVKPKPENWAFECSELSITPEVVNAGKSITISANLDVPDNGDASDIYCVVLITYSGSVVSEQKTKINKIGKVPASWTFNTQSNDSGHSYQIHVELSRGRFKVERSGSFRVQGLYLPPAPPLRSPAQQIVDQTRTNMINQRDAVMRVLLARNIDPQRISNFVTADKLMSMGDDCYRKGERNRARSFYQQAQILYSRSISLSP